MRDILKKGELDRTGIMTITNGVKQMNGTKILIGRIKVQEETIETLITDLTEALLMIIEKMLVNR